MLAALEARLLTVLRDGLPDGLQIESGPVPGPAPPVGSVVRVAALSLETEPPGNAGALLDGRGHSHIGRTLSWDSDGAQRDFALPDDAAGAVVEVEAPPGRPLRRGDAYFLDERSVRFYQPPAAGAPGVRARLRGDRARGYQETRPCRVELALGSRALTMVAADAGLDQALRLLLAGCAELGTIEPEAGGDAPVRLRLLRPLATLHRIERTAELVAGAPVYRAQATLRLLADLEMSVAVGVPEAEGVIEEIVYAARPAGRRPPGTGG